MNASPKLKPNRWDGLVAAAVLALALLLGARGLFARTDTAAPLTAVVERDGVELLRCALSSLPEGGEERLIEAGGYTLHLRLAPNGVSVAAADCPTQDCVHTGTVSRAGQSIVCLPAHVVITLLGDAEYDLIAG